VSPIRGPGGIVISAAFFALLRGLLLGEEVPRSGRGGPCPWPDGRAEPCAPIRARRQALGAFRSLVLSGETRLLLIRPDE